MQKIKKILILFLEYTAKELNKMDRQDLIDKFIEQQSFAISTLQKFAEVKENNQISGPPYAPYTDL